MLPPTAPTRCLPGSLKARDDRRPELLEAPTASRALLNSLSNTLIHAWTGSGVAGTCCPCPVGTLQHPSATCPPRPGTWRWWVEAGHLPQQTHPGDMLPSAVHVMFDPAEHSPVHLLL